MRLLVRTWLPVLLAVASLVMAMIPLVLQEALAGRPLLVILAVLAAMLAIAFALAGAVMGVRRFERHRASGRAAIGLFGVFVSALSGLVGCACLVYTLAIL